ncbi:MAG: hypothetical protein L6R41_004281 [Letrouitia leprolyta]|nr:MAG: hypothetical protein L6R41_004281 [Letrouitia leprolyta]
MSFGTSASDIALLVQLAWKTLQGARAACGEYDELTRQTSSLHIVLNRLQLEIASSESSIGRRESYRRELAAVAAGCQDVLTQLDKILVKYNALSEQERSVRRLWKKIRFGNGVVADVAELRSRVTYYTSALSLLLNLVSVGTIGTVEKKMDEAGGDLRDIRAAVNKITAHLLATEGQEGSVLTTYTNDDRDAWRELRRELVKDGFHDSIVRRHMDTIMAYVKELGSRGILDDIKVDENDMHKDDLAHNQLEQEIAEDTKGEMKWASNPMLSTVGEILGPAKRSRDSKERLTSSSEEGLQNLHSTGLDEPLGSPEILPIDTVQPSEQVQSMDLPKGLSSADPVDGKSLPKYLKAGAPSFSSYPGGEGFRSSTRYKKSNLLKDENLRYYSSTAMGSPERLGLIFLDDLELPNFIGDRCVIYKTHQQVRSARRFGVEAQFDLVLKIEGLQRRILCLVDPNRFSRSAKNLVKPEEKESMMQKAVNLLFRMRVPTSTSTIKACDIEGLDFRRVTTLCSMFIVDFIRTNNCPVTAPLIDDIIKDIHRWGLRFSKLYPEEWDQILEYYGPKLGYPVPKRYSVRAVIGVSSLAGVYNTPPIEQRGQWYPHPNMKVGDRPYPWIVAPVHEYPPWQPPLLLSALRYWDNKAHASRGYLEPLLGFIGALGNYGATPDTIEQCLAVIVKSHIDFDSTGSWLGAFEDPRIRHAMKSVSATHIQRRKEITRDEISELIKNLDDSQDHVVLRSFICLAFAGSFRMSDLILSSQSLNHSIFDDPFEMRVSRSSVTILDEHFDITLHASWSPSYRTLGKYSIHATSDDICPVSAMRKVLQIPGSDETPLFRLSSRDGLTANVVIEFLRERLENLGHETRCANDGLCNADDSVESIMRQWSMDVHGRFLDTDPDAFFVRRPRRSETRPLTSAERLESTRTRNERNGIYSN